MRRSVPGTLALLLVATPALAGIGDFDYAFGRNGFVDNPLALLPDGRVLYFADDISPLGSISAYDNVPTIFNSLLFRRGDANGHPDLTYGAGGSQGTLTDFEYTYSSARTVDGKLLLAGRVLNRPILLRMNSDGNQDAGYGGAGYVAPHDPGLLPLTGWVEAIAVQPDRRVLALVSDRSGFYSSPTTAVLRRLNVDGTADPAFSIGQSLSASPGQLYCSTCSGPIAVLPGGDIRVGGMDNPVYFSASGAIEAAPAGRAELPANTANWKIAAAFPAGGSLLIGTTVAAVGTSGPLDYGTDILLARQRADGSLDRSFGSGYAAFDFGLLALGRAGLYQRVRTVTLSADGSRAYIAVEFRSTTSVSTQYGLAADSGFAIARVLLQPNGTVSLDTTFGSNGFVLLAPALSPFVLDMVEPPGQAVVVVLSNGWASWAIRLLGDASSSRGIISVDSMSPRLARASDREVRIPIRRVGGSGPLSVSYKSAYAATSGQISWADGDAADKVIRIPITTDGALGSSESLTVSLSAPGGAYFSDGEGEATSFVQASILFDVTGTTPPATGNSGSSAVSTTTTSAKGGGGALTGITLLWLAGLGAARASRRCRRPKAR